MRGGVKYFLLLSTSFLICKKLLFLEFSFVSPLLCDCVISLICMSFFIFITKSKIKTTLNKAKATGIFGNFPYSSCELKLHSGTVGFTFYRQKRSKKKA